MFTTLLAKIARVLTARSLPYMVIGGQAVLRYGEPRLTRDIDISLGASLEQLGEILTLLEAHGFVPLVEPETFVAQTMVLPCQDRETGIRVDFVFAISPYEQQALRRTRAVTMEGTPVAFAAPEDLVIHKIIAGRPRDLEDVRGILLKHPTLDMAYLRQWLGDYSAMLGQPLLETFERLWRDSQ